MYVVIWSYTIFNGIVANIIGLPMHMNRLLM